MGLILLPAVSNDGKKATIATVSARYRLPSHPAEDVCYRLRTRTANRSRNPNDLPNRGLRMLTEYLSRATVGFLFLFPIFVFHFPVSAAPLSQARLDVVGMTVPSDMLHEPDVEGGETGKLTGLYDVLVIYEGNSADEYLGEIRDSGPFLSLSLVANDGTLYVLTGIRLGAVIILQGPNDGCHSGAMFVGIWDGIESVFGSTYCKAGGFKGNWIAVLQ